jgi:hypothetical protein
VQLSDTQILSPHVINETRFQFIRDTTSQLPNLPEEAAIKVLGEFTSGGSTVGPSTDTLNRYELQNYTSWSLGKHFVKFGGRLRVTQDNNYSTANEYGTYTFSSLAAYNAYINGTGTPSQYLVTQINNPLTKVSYADAGLYAEDDWRLRPNLTLSYGLRYETQSSISDKADFAPRLGLSWGLGGAKSAPKTVLRVGCGIFYDRFTEDLVLRAQQLNGISQQQVVVTYPNLPCTAPSCSTIPSSSSAIYRINPNLRTPYTMQTAVSLERQLGRLGTISFTYINSRGPHQLILENINVPQDGAVPIGGNIYQYNSAAVFEQNQFITNVQIRISQKLSLTGFYALGYANSNTSGPNSSPSNQYDLWQDYGRASYDVRHRIFLVGSASLAHNVRLSPFVIFNSGAPFNITTGTDSNGDSFFNDRPAFAAPGASGPNIVHGFNINPTATDKLFPVNYGNGPANLTVNMRISKTFGFGPEVARNSVSSSEQGPQGGHKGAPGGGFAGPRGMGGLFGPSSTPHRYNLTFTMTTRNIFNTWNPGPPIGTLTSTRFGESNTVAGGPFSSGTANRRVDFQAIFSF